MALFEKARRSLSRLGERHRPGERSPVSDLPFPFSFAMLSHVGRVRTSNEDTCAANPAHGIFVVCDGMGGAAAGEVASRLAANVFLESLTPHPASAEAIAPRRATPDVRIDDAIHAANRAVYDHAQSNPDLRGMGTTLVALLLEQPSSNDPEAAPSLTLAHVGDSRCYLFRSGHLVQLTQDHSLVEEQVRSGRITAEEAERHPMRNIITRAVGSQAMVEPEITHLEPYPGDLLLLASDGLTRELPDSALQTLLTRAFTLHSQRKGMFEPFLDLQSLCQTMVNQANDAGGADNITVLLLQLP